jgi:integration host factor subunit beta
MIKSELIEQLYKKQTHLSFQDVELVVNCIVNKMSDALGSGERIEVRGFGSFSLRERLPMMGRNPRTGEPVALAKRYSVRFKAGLELAKRVRDSVEEYKISK